VIRVGHDLTSPGPRQPIDIATLSGFLNSLHSYSFDLIQHLQSGQKLCHYTSLESMIGIVSRRDLWLTNSRFSNDDEELNYGHRIVDEVLDELDAATTNDPAKGDLIRLLRAFVAACRDDQVYICCFCEKDNLLSQWRGYADGGGGVSIEFEPSGFAGLSGPDCAHGLMRLWKIFYDREQQQKIVHDCISYPWPATNNAEKVSFIVDALEFFMPTFKNGDFREEQERRLIFTPYPAVVPKPQFRTRRGLVVPYFSLQELSNPLGQFDPAFRLPISRILIGPSAQCALNVQSVKLMLQPIGYSNVSVEASTTPYRG
jgi:Protein of unknown function (DUF2971)